MEAKMAEVGFGFGMLLKVVFEVAGLFENLVTALVQALELLVVSTGYIVRDLDGCIPIFRYSWIVVFYSLSNTLFTSVFKFGGRLCDFGGCFSLDELILCFLVDDFLDELGIIFEPVSL